eukprot:TRINITY_DN1929_c0_g1_i1.p1 TRINITY_DN1929_c0_g1~~TRINITY_DN1929_c0_g1_i1.p1  ORF type:complete len:397 (-),score=59.15 TRINITY_DN1929_c0_g1_i1:209-1399(-)
MGWPRFGRKTVGDEGKVEREDAAVLSSVTESDMETALAILRAEDDALLKKGWKLAIDKSTDSMSYRAWWRELPSSSATQFRTVMVVENCCPETARDFFLDDEFRKKWDESRVSCATLQDWDDHGCQVVRWVRRFPWFLRDREYVVIRRVLHPEEEGKRTFYCISKLTSHPLAPKQQSPMRVESFRSSWLISPCPARDNPGQLTACEVIHLHEESSGLSRSLTRMAVLRGMWPYVLNVEQNLRRYGSSSSSAQDTLSPTPSSSSSSASSSSSSSPSSSTPPSSSSTRRGVRGFVPSFLLHAQESSAISDSLPHIAPVPCKIQVMHHLPTPLLHNHYLTQQQLLQMENVRANFVLRCLNPWLEHFQSRLSAVASPHSPPHSHLQVDPYCKPMEGGLFE